MTRQLRAVLYTDDGLVLVYTDGTASPLLPGGHPRPGSAHATARVSK